jgi:hypothetical protein
LPRTVYSKDTQADRFLFLGVLGPVYCPPWAQGHLKGIVKPSLDCWGISDASMKNLPLSLRVRLASRSDDSPSRTCSHFISSHRHFP